MFNLLSLVFKVVLEMLPFKIQFLNDCCHLEGFTKCHSFGLDIMQNYLTFLHLTSYIFGIHHHIVKKSSNNKFLYANILCLIFFMQGFSRSLCCFADYKHYIVSHADYSSYSSCISNQSASKHQKH